jgi:outer membrane immunogenic protein
MEAKEKKMGRAKSISEFTFFSSATIALTAVGTGDAYAQQDISGFYGGLSLGVPDGDNFLDYGSEYSFDGAAIGAMLGYNVVKGDWVYGGELNYVNKYDVSQGSGGSFYSGMGLGNVIDLRGRIGRAFGNTLVYGAAGVTFADVDTAGGLSTSAEGFNFGIGVEHSIGQRGFVGVELIRRNLDVDPGVYSGSESLNMNTASIRLGMRF